MYYVSKSIWLTSSAYPDSNYLDGLDAHVEFPTSLNPVNSTTLWTVGKNASGSYSSMTASATATNFSTTIKPDATLSSTIGEGWVFGPYTGVFARNTMSLQLNYSTTNTRAQAGFVQYRLWKASDLAGSNASLITPTIRSTNIITFPVGGGSINDRVTSGSFLMTSSVVMNNEYLYIEAAWAITTAGTQASANIIFRAGSGSFFRTGPYEDNTFVALGND